MKVWAKVHIADKNKDVEVVSKSLTNYLYRYGPMSDLALKYHISKDDLHRINQYTINRIAGLLMFYLSKDYKRINDIVNKYNVDSQFIHEVIPEIEGYVEK